MSVTRVQAITDQSDTGVKNISLTLTSPREVGNTLILVVGSDTYNPVESITDSGESSWEIIRRGVKYEVWYLPNALTANQNLTVVRPIESAYTAILGEYSGILAIDAIDISAYDLDPSSTTVFVDAPCPNHSPEPLMLACIMNSDQTKSLDLAASSAGYDLVASETAAGRASVEHVANGDFSSWTAGDPDSWTVEEYLPDNEVSEVGTGLSHGGGGSGSCNLYDNGDTRTAIRQDIVLTYNVSYQLDIDISAISGTLYAQDDNGKFLQSYTSTGVKSIVFTASTLPLRLNIYVDGVGADITIDSASIIKNYDSHRSSVYEKFPSNYSDESFTAEIV